MKKTNVVMASSTIKASNVFEQNKESLLKAINDDFNGELQYFLSCEILDTRAYARADNETEAELNFEVNIIGEFKDFFNDKFLFQNGYKEEDFPNWNVVWDELKKWWGYDDKGIMLISELNDYEGLEVLDVRYKDGELKIKANLSI